MRRPPLDVDAQLGHALARRDDVAVGARTLEDEAGVALPGEPPDVGRRAGRADLLVRVGEVGDALERQAGRPRELVQRPQGMEAGEQPRLHVGDAGAVGASVGDAEGARRRGPHLEDRVEVRQHQETRPIIAPQRADHRRPEAPLRVGFVAHLGPEPLEESAGPAPDPVDASRRVAAAVGVYERRQVVEEDGKAPLDPGTQGGEFGVADPGPAGRSALGGR